MFKVSTIASTARLEDLALPADRLEQLRAVARQPTGAVLLTGPSGAARTLAAEALAGAAGRALWRVELGQVASAYIGETEKNLDRLFATAAASGAVLLFDEADALFGKRGGVHDSHDRYANVEVGHLLQRVESHSGLVLFAANIRQDIDPAFVRRLRCIVDLSGPPTRG